MLQCKLTVRLDDAFKASAPSPLPVTSGDAALGRRVVAAQEHGVLASGSEPRSDRLLEMTDHRQ